jgi:hypothetical protein
MVLVSSIHYVNRRLYALAVVVRERADAIIHVLLCAGNSSQKGGKRVRAGGSSREAFSGSTAR